MVLSGFQDSPSWPRVLKLLNHVVWWLIVICDSFVTRLLGDQATLNAHFWSASQAYVQLESSKNIWLGNFHVGKHEVVNFAKEIQALIRNFQFIRKFSNFNFPTFSIFQTIPSNYRHAESYDDLLDPEYVQTVFSWCSKRWSNHLKVVLSCLLDMMAGLRVFKSIFSTFSNIYK